MTIPLAVPVMAACLMITTPGVDDGSYSTVATTEIVACTPCNEAVKECQIPPNFERLVRDAIAKAMKPAPGNTEARAAAKKPTKKPRRHKR